MKLLNDNILYSRVTDSGLALTSEDTLTVFIKDVNDNAPRFTSKTEIEVREDTSVGKLTEFTVTNSFEFLYKLLQYNCEFCSFFAYKARTFFVMVIFTFIPFPGTVLYVAAAEDVDTVGSLTFSIKGNISLIPQ